jgi:hypothetical protein
MYFNTVCDRWEWKCMAGLEVDEVFNSPLTKKGWRSHTSHLIAVTKSVLRPEAP